MAVERPEDSPTSPPEGGDAVALPRPRLQTVSLAVIGGLALILALLAALVGGSLLGIVRIAAETHDRTVPRVLLQHRDALAAAELGRLAEVILNHGDRGRRGAALEEAEGLAARFSDRSDPAIVERLGRAIDALRMSSHRADLIDSLSASIREGLSELDDALANATRLLAEPDRGVQDYVFLSNLYQLRRLYDRAMQADTGEALALLDLEILRLVRAQRALLTAIQTGGSEYLDGMLLLLQRFSDARTLSDLHRGRLAVRSQIRQDIDAAHGSLRQLSQGLAGGAAAAMLTTSDRIVEIGHYALWVGLAGVSITLLLLVQVIFLVRRHVVAPVVALSERLGRAPTDGRIEVPPAYRLEELDRIGRAVARFVEMTADLHRQADALRSEEARLGSILDSAPFPVMIARRRDGRLLFANAQCAELLALPQERRPRFSLADILIDPGEAMALPATLYRLNSATSLETRFRGVGGRRFWGMLTAVAMEYEGAGAMFLAVQDISARKEAEEALHGAMDEAERALAELRRTQRSLVQTEKLASLGALVAGIAHEINTPVGIGVTAASFLDEEAGRLRAAIRENSLKRSDLEQFAERVVEASGIILSNLERASSLVQSFKQVAVDQTSEARRRFELRDYLEDVLGSLAPGHKRTPHRVVLECPERVEMDSFPGALSQVVSNLVINALTHAFDEERPGTVTVRTLAQENGEILLEVTDDGRGIPAADREKVFEPFFTTRRGEGGSGLGLHIVHNLVVGPLGGRIALSTPPGGGSRFTVTVPRQAPGAAAAA